MATPFEVQQAINSNYQKRTLLQTRLKALSAQGVSLSSAGLSRQLVNEAAKNTAGVTGEILSQIGLFYNDAVRERRRSLETAYGDVGRQANKAVAAKYRRTKGRGGAGAYRANASGKYKRDAGGKLGRALTSDNMFLAGPDGIAYVNMPYLDSQARQWYRLNFGAGARGQASQRPASKRVIFFGEQTSLDVGLQGLGPSASFSMPGGLFTNSDGQALPFNPSRRGKDAFNPGNYLKNRPNLLARSSGVKLKQIQTQGIAAQNYLDAGTDVISRGVPNVTTKFIRGILQESFAAGGAKGAPARAGLDTKNIERLLTQVSIEVENLPRSARIVGSNLF